MVSGDQSNAGAQSVGADSDDPLRPADIAKRFPPDPDLMVSPEGDTRGLREAQDEARADAGEQERE